MTYADMMEHVVVALVTQDTEELAHLKSLDGAWYEDILMEIETMVHKKARKMRGEEFC